jgi:ankyrin repeat protein
LFLLSNDIPKVKELLAGGAGVNARNIIDNTPLMEASSRGFTEMAELLIAKGADRQAGAK